MFLEYFWLVVSLAFSSGILLSNVFLDQWQGKVFLFFSLFAIFFVGFFIILRYSKILRRDLLALCLVFISFFFLAVWRYLIAWPIVNSSRIEYYVNERVRLLGEVASEINFKNDQQKIKLKVLKTLKDGQELDVRGNILLTAPLYPAYDFGDVLEVSGDLVAGGYIDDFNYGLYLRRNHISLLSYRPQIKKINSTQKSLVLKNIFYFKNYLIDQFEANLSSELASVAKAILLGDKGGLSSEQREVFSQSGLSHIVAISGLHISLLSSYLFSFFLIIGFNRRRSFYLINLFLILYLTLIAWPASAIRASLMGFLSSLAIYLNRLGSTANALFFSGFVLLLINPFLLLADLGFQLSFLAVLGIIYIYPRLKDITLRFLEKKKMPKRKRKKISKVVDVFSLTLSAQITTAPVLIKSFEQFSLIAPLSNFLVLWSVPVVIIFLIISSFLSAFFPFFSVLFFRPPEILLQYLSLVAKNVLLIPHSFISVDHWPLSFSIIYYCLLIYLLFRKKRTGV